MRAHTAADLIFSNQANHNFSKVQKELKRSNLSIHNRLDSINQDATFVQRLAEIYKKPLIANERCGSWYIASQEKASSAYFKSTDGHTGEWQFSQRRLNLHLLDIIGMRDGCIIVDSTRRGKRMPDALSKTIPIWCSVFNRFLFPEQPDCHELFTPPQVVSRSEHEQITALVPLFLERFCALKIPPHSLKASLTKPLRPFWVTSDSNLYSIEDVFPDHHLVICCTVSRCVKGSEVGEGGYIQGAGDDTENWAHGLTPTIFWANRHSLLSSSEEELPLLITNLIEATKSNDVDKIASICIKPTTNLFVTSNANIETMSKDDNVFVVNLLPKVLDQSNWTTSRSLFNIGIGPHKVGSRILRSALPSIIAWVRNTFTNFQLEGSSNTQSIILACETGKDHSLGVAVALLCLFYDDTGSVIQDVGSSPQVINKLLIRQRLSWISRSIPDAHPSRSTLQSVNSVLIGNPG